MKMVPGSENQELIPEVVVPGTTTSGWSSSSGCGGAHGYGLRSWKGSRAAGSETVGPLGPGK